MGAGHREQRARRIGLAISVVAHLLLIALYPLFSIDPSTVTLSESEPPTDPILEGTEVIELVELEPEEPTPEPPTVEEPVPEPQPAVAAAPAPRGADEPTESGDEEEENPATVAERMAPRLTEPRLWGPLEPGTTDLTDEERAQRLLAGMIQTWNDSVAVAAALTERMRDWTFTDDSGNRWGLADGRLYLGDFSVPIPLSLQAPAFQRDRIREWQTMLQDIQQGAITAQIRETWADRARVIRERLEAEREARMRAEDGG